MADSFIRMPNFWITMLKFLLSISCYVLFCYYYKTNLLFCNPKTYPPTDREFRMCYLHSQIAVTACVGFTFLIEPAIILAYIAMAEHYERTILNHVFALAGSIAYITGGSIIICYTRESSMTEKKPYNATGSMFIITGILYLAHFALTLFNRVKP